MATSIQVSERLRKRLLRHKESPRQTYEEVIAKALDLLEEDDLEFTPEFKKQLREGRRDLAAGRYYTTEELLKELGL